MFLLCVLNSKIVSSKNTHWIMSKSSLNRMLHKSEVTVSKTFKSIAACFLVCYHCTPTIVARNHSKFALTKHKPSCFFTSSPHTQPVLVFLKVVCEYGHTNIRWATPQPVKHLITNAFLWEKSRVCFLKVYALHEPLKLKRLISLGR